MARITDINVNKDILVDSLKAQNARLKKLLRETAEERDRYKSLWEANRIQNEVSEEERKAKRRLEQEQKQERLLSGVKSDGIAIAHAADSIRSYDEMCAVLDGLKNSGRMGVRNWAMFRCGICFGLRASDLVKLKWEWVIDENGEFRERIPVVENKTGKINRCFISEAIKETLMEYRQWLDGKNCSPDDYIFSKSTGAMLQPPSYSKILKEAGRAAQIPIHISSHTMRKSFANIMLCCYDGGANDYAMRDLQGLLGHSDVRITMRYLDDTILRYDAARKAVSDFVLGKTDVNELVVQRQISNNEIYKLCEEMLGKVA